MGNTPNSRKTSPGITVSANVDKAYQETTAGAGVQKKESHYQKIVDRAINRDGDKQGRR